MNIEDGDHELIDGAAWLEIGPYAVRIILLENGALAVRVYENKNEMDWPLDTIEVKL